MRYFRNIFFALAAFLWLPAAAHCQIELLTGQSFFRCDSVQQAACNPCSGCDEGTCCPVEKSQYQASQLRVSLPPPVLFSVLIIALPEDQAPAAEAATGILTAAPPQLLKTWHFLSRTALPIRAPSFAS